MIKKIGLALVCGLICSGNLLCAAKGRAKRRSDDTVSSSRPLKTHAVLATPAYDPGRLYSCAETRGFGYKTGNLHELRYFCNWFNEQGVGSPVLVPEFLGISSQSVQDLLACTKFDITAAWRTVVMAPALGGAESEGSVANLTAFDEQFMRRRQAFEEQLSAAFDVLIADPDIIIAWAAECGVAEFLELVKARNAKLMVRSTGKEDTETLANAGGNKSVPYVRPELQAVVGAMKEVVISYFAKKSLSQRLCQNDPTVFSPTVFIPVLLQEMVFETATAIPTSGVLFTQDQQTEMHSGVSIVQAAFGHGEGVVNSLVPVDTYYATYMSGDSWSLYPIITNKSDRLVPIEGSTALRRVRNDEHYAKQSSLSNKMVKLLAMFGQAVEQYYKRPMDIEFVVQNDQLFIVQARPLVPRAYGPGEAPSYIPDDIKREMVTAGAWQAITSGSAIVASGGSTRLVENAKQVIIAKTISEALAVYSDKKVPAQQAVRAIIVGSKAPSTSHEATTFRGEGKPVVFLPGWEVVKQAVTEKKQLLIDVQQGQVIVADSFPSKEEVVMSGWITYPGECALSLEPSFFARPVETPSMPELKNKPIPAMHVLLHQLKVVVTPEEVRKIAAIIVYRVMAMINRAGGGLALDQDLAMEKRLLVRGVKQLCHDIGMWAAEGNEGFMRKLLSIRLLEALIYQQDADIVKGFSAATLGKTLYIEKGIEAATAGMVFPSPQEKALYVQLAKIPAIMCSDELKMAWMQFIGVVAQDHEFMQRLAHLIKQLAACDMLSSWLHTECASQLLGFTITDKSVVSSFATGMWEKCKGIASSVIAWGAARLGWPGIGASQARTMILSWEQAVFRDQVTMQMVKALRQYVEMINLAAFASPETFGSAWESLQQELINKIVHPSFVEAFKSSGNVGREAVCSLLVRAIEVFDLAIKAMKGNNAWSPEERAQLFHTMLQRYRDVLFGLTPLAPALLYVTQSDISDKTKWLDGYQELINRGINRPFTTADLRGTQGLSTPAYTIGSGTLIQRDLFGKPTTGEDFFTIIHQSLLVVVSSISPYSLSEIAQPLLLKQCEEIIFGKALTDGPLPVEYRRQRDQLFLPEAHMVGTRITDKGITVYYNMPLRNHSARFELIFDNKTQTVDLMAHFYGREDARWAHIVVDALHSEIAHLVVQVKECTLKKSGVSFVFQIRDGSPAVLQELHKKIYQMALTTLSIAPLPYSFEQNPLLAKQLEERAETLLDQYGIKTIQREVFGRWDTAFFKQSVDREPERDIQSFMADWLALHKKYKGAWGEDALYYLLFKRECEDIEPLLPIIFREHTAMQSAVRPLCDKVRCFANSFSIDPVLGEIFSAPGHLFLEINDEEKPVVWERGLLFYRVPPQKVVDATTKQCFRCICYSDYNYCEKGIYAPDQIMFTFQFELECRIDRSTPEQPMATINLNLVLPLDEVFYRRLYAKIAETIVDYKLEKCVRMMPFSMPALCTITYQAGGAAKNIADFIANIRALGRAVFREQQEDEREVEE